MSERSQPTPDISNGSIVKTSFHRRVSPPPPASSRIASDSSLRFELPSRVRGADLQDSNETAPSDSGSDSEDMGDRRPPLRRGSAGRSEQPLLHKSDEDRGRTVPGGSPELERPPIFSRRSTMRSTSPDTQARVAMKKKYMYAGFFLLLSLIGFTVQTETAAYVQHELGWNKAYCMMYLTHGSWIILWPAQLLILKAQKWNMPWKTFWRRHVYLIRTTAQMVEIQELEVPRGQRSPIPYFIRKTTFITCALTVAGGSWYFAINLTTPADLTAIYNCSAFFAYVFSVLLLKEPLRWDKSFAVLLAIIGVLVVAYGDSTPTKQVGNSGAAAGRGPSSSPGGNEDESKDRLLGNIIIGVGSVLYGLYEVLYKKLACPPEGTSPGRGMIFANTFGTFMGIFTLLVLWIPLPILHYTGLERFELPRGQAAWLLLISIAANAIYCGSFLIMMSLTSPVLSSVAALLTIFIVAIVHWLLTGEPLSAAAIGGGLLIIVAFSLLSWSTFRELQEARRKLKIDADVAETDEESERDDNRAD